MSNTTDTPIAPRHALSGHTNAVSALTMVNGLLYSSSKDGSIREWDVSSGKELRIFSGHKRWVRSLCRGPENLLYSGSRDDTVREWSLQPTPSSATVECTRIFEGAHELGINAIWFDTFGRQRLYSGGDDGTICVWDVDVGEHVDTWGTGSQTVTAMLGFGAALFTGFTDGSVGVWDVESGETLGSWSGHLAEVSSLALANGRLYSGGNDKKVCEWDISTGELQRTFAGHGGFISSLAVSDDGKLFSGSWDATVRVWDLDTGSCVGVLEVGKRSVNALYVDGETLITGTGDGIIKIWEIGKRHAN
ncbi:hypothetical protein HK104_009320 [Borealophlyctis nickersoniae]|nr:hypothetical protein HK104_009320 [Borealophlyctis nickersoniae]